MPEQPAPTPAEPAAREQTLPKAARKHLTRELGWTPRATPPVPAADLEPRATRLPAEVRAELVALLGEDQVADDRETRLRHTGGTSYLDRLRRRQGDASDAPDAVLTPADTGQTAAVLALCSARGVVVVPWGGGTSPVGGLPGTDADDRPVVVLDLARMASVRALDVPSSLVTVGPGMRAPALAEALQADGLALDRLPQDLAEGTLGGHAATGTSGFDRLVAGLTLATPTGVLELGRPPAPAAGPDLLALALGSEGTLGVVTELRLQVRPEPRARHHEGWSLRSWAAGLAALQRLARHDLLPDVVALGDPAHTRTGSLLAGGSGARALRGLLRSRRHGGDCLLVLGWEGLPTVVRARRAAASSLLRESGAMRLGTRAGAPRAAVPQLRDQLLDQGLLVETLETAATWSALPTVYDAVRRALRESLSRPGHRPLVLTHVAHGYATGASLVVTVLADRDDDLPLQQWLTAKRAATDALLGAGGTLTHQHGVGADHRPWLEEEVGTLGVDVLRAVKARLDPQGVCNPGVLLPG
ncbi:alkyldihydroxyacetonephosphate synthase [Geodermatophilus sp. Leaf369]|uniref:FAD-binding oxidoreductase n=1 Tax=Geodermatophilus sp. Leaf369 TaxID=1736354 RepID=UPI0006FE7E3A|nr:FAD-binding oxidoreductase [Geodermatophilus sp. Leaf369]KQS60816.1 alkyldihydroxyacetonephosphate synthase [Geodermatophilus sp. Leaf369]